MKLDMIEPLVLTLAMMKQNVRYLHRCYRRLLFIMGWGLFTGLGIAGEEIGMVANALAVKDELLHIGHRVMDAIMGQKTNI